MMCEASREKKDLKCRSFIFSCVISSYPEINFTLDSREIEKLIELDISELSEKMDASIRLINNNKKIAEKLMPRVNIFLGNYKSFCFDEYEKKMCLALFIIIIKQIIGMKLIPV